MKTYTYIAKDGEQITGTAEEIRDIVLNWHGDAALARLSRPTDYTYGTVPGYEPYAVAAFLDAGTDWAGDQALTLEEVGILNPDLVLAEYLAVAEDRPVKHVTAALA